MSMSGWPGLWRRQARLSSCMDLEIVEDIVGNGGRG
jgi:hypothetical protein